MPVPSGSPIIDTLIGFPTEELLAAHRQTMRGTSERSDSRSEISPISYMFKDHTFDEALSPADAVAMTIDAMDRCGVAQGMIGVGTASGDFGDTAALALARHPERFIGSIGIDANDGMRAVREIVRASEDLGARAVTLFPAGSLPQVAINDRKMYPIYAKCIELGLPVFCTAGIPGPRVRTACQHVELIDDVMYDFPELTFVMRHGGEPWQELAVKLMVKWPGLHFSTSGFAPRYYAQAIIDFANTRGADRVLYAGYFPMGLTLDRIMSELDAVPLKDDVWPAFLHMNARRILGLGT